MVKQESGMSENGVGVWEWWTDIIISSSHHRCECSM